MTSNIPQNTKAITIDTNTSETIGPNSITPDGYIKVIHRFWTEFLPIGTNYALTPTCDDNNAYTTFPSCYQE